MGFPIIIDFGADSCIPCKEMAPVLKKLNEEWQGKVIVKFVDVWKYPDAADSISFAGYILLNSSLMRRANLLFPVILKGCRCKCTL